MKSESPYGYIGADSKAAEDSIVRFAAYSGLQWTSEMRNCVVSAFHSAIGLTYTNNLFVSVKTNKNQGRHTVDHLQKQSYFKGNPIREHGRLSWALLKAGLPFLQFH